MLKINIDGVTWLELISALGIGHRERDLVIVPARADDKPGTAIELGHTWKRIIIDNEVDVLGNDKELALKDVGLNAAISNLRDAARALLDFERARRIQLCGSRRTELEQLNKINIDQLLDEV